MVEVFGIPIIAGSKFENSGKLNHVASVMAELLDQDGDGWAGDPNVLRNLLKPQVHTMSNVKYQFRKAFVLPNKKNHLSKKQKKARAAANAAMNNIAMKNDKHIGFESTTDVGFPQIKPQYSVHQLCNETVCYKDNTIEEVYHFITQYGISKAYSKIFGMNWQAPSNLTKAMDIARYFFGFNFSY